MSLGFLTWLGPQSGCWQWGRQFSAGEMEGQVGLCSVAGGRADGRRGCRWRLRGRWAVGIKWRGEKGTGLGHLPGWGENAPAGGGERGEEGV